jgi:hypothetical protein
MHPLQEKFQITVPNKQETKDDENWVFPGVDNRASASQRDCLGGSHGFWNKKDEVTLVDDRKFNQLPPGMEIGNQMRKQRDSMPLSLAGATDVSSKVVEQGSIDKGFARLEMKGTDDQYTGEHVDHFYGDAGGFVERNNYLDRE